MSVNRIIKSFRDKILEKTNPFFAKYRIRKISNPAFTIISNNCWGAKIYRYFGLPYETPTVGLYFFPDDFLRFVSNLKYYLSLDLSFISADKSKYYQILKKRGHITKPIGLLDDVEIVFLHFKDEQDASEKWERRKQRIHFDNLFFKFSEMNGCSLSQLQQFDNLPLQNKLVFVTKDYKLKSQVVYKSNQRNGQIYNDTDDFIKYFDIFQWINSGKIQKK